MGKKKFASTSSAKAKNMAARLVAAQAIYQSLHNDQSLKSIYDELITHREFVDAEGQEMVKPDGVLLKKIVMGVEERKADLEAILQANSGKENRVIEPLLKAILMAGAYELMANMEVDAPIVINDYLNVTHAFYETGEVSLVNATLDSIAKSLRQ